jgi:hypothetical protein
MQKTLSILILSIEGREDKLNRLLNEIASQVKKHNLFDDIQVLVSKDKRGEHIIGYKRNLCLQHAEALWEMFVDDDDMLAPESLFHIVKNLKEKNPDCIALEGIITENGTNPKKFIHSLRYNEWFEKDNIYYRSPNHLNPIRTSISKNFKFPEINHGEDKEWSMAISKAGVLKSEAKIGFPYYYYEYMSNK